jgi:hypothetical protein
MAKQRTWQLLGQGNYNWAFVNQERTLVLKVQKLESTPKKPDIGDELDTPSRSVRLWNEINYNLTTKAALIEHGLRGQIFYNITNDKKQPIRTNLGWSCPFIEGRKSSPAEIQSALIDIYNRTGRVILDAIAEGNFVTIEKGPDKGKVVCIDIGMSFRLQTNNPRRNSLTSLAVWNQKAEARYFPWFNKYLPKPHYNKTLTTVKALLALQKYFPVVVNASFLRDSANEALLRALADELDRPGHFHQNPKNIRQLKAFYPPWPAALIQHLEHYIASRGELSLNGHFSASLSTKLFRDHQLTRRKVCFAQSLLAKLKQTTDKSLAIELIDNALSHPDSAELFKARVCSGLKESLIQCQKVLTIESAPVPSPLCG